MNVDKRNFLVALPIAGFLLCTGVQFCRAGGTLKRHRFHAAPSVVIELEQAKHNIDNARPHLKKVTKNITGTDNGGEIDALIEGQRVLMLTAILWKSNQVETTTFYFDQGRLFLALRRQDYYSWDKKKEEFDATRLIKGPQNKYYFKRNSIIFQTSHGRLVAIPKVSKETAKTQVDLLHDSAIFAKFVLSEKATLSL